MTKLSIEAKVGFLVVIGIIILAYMCMKVGKFEYKLRPGYEIYSYFDSAEGLVKGAPVQIAGIEVGQVKEIALEAGKAKVTLVLKPDVKVGKDVQAAIRTKGVLGDKYVELIPGVPRAPTIQPGGRIQRTVSAANIDVLLTRLGAIAEDIKQITGSLSSVVGGKEGEASLKTITTNLRELAKTLNETAQRNSENIDQILHSFNVFSNDLKDLSRTNKEPIRQIVASMRETSSQLQETILALKEITEKINRGEGTIGKLVHDKETIETINKTLVALNDIAGKINKGEGTIGKLVQEEETIENINTTLTGINDYLQKEEKYRTYLDYRGEYLLDGDSLKSYLSLRIQPKEDKYYLLQVIDDPAGKRTVTDTTTTINGGIPVTEHKEEIEKDEIKFSAQIAKRYYNLGLRGGLFESTGGVAADYYLFDDRLVLSLEAFDFDPDKNPHLKFKADYTPFQYVYLTGGVDDFISDDDNASLFIGAGLHFSDEDIKTLLSGAPIPK